jgi:hypothetical protein
MGIEPTGKALPELENKRFGAMTNAKCDWRVNFRGMWGHVGQRGDARRLRFRLKPFCRSLLPATSRLCARSHARSGHRTAVVATVCYDVLQFDL